MASRFATFSKDEILAINEAAAPTNTTKEINLVCRCLLVGRKKNCPLNLQQNHKKMIPETPSIER